MNSEDRQKLIGAVKKIPCQLTIFTFDAARDGSAWLGCKECPRCVLLHKLQSGASIDGIYNALANEPDNGGYRLRSDLRVLGEPRESAQR